MSHSLDDEHRRLLAVTDALEREHENLHQRPAIVRLTSRIATGFGVTSQTSTTTSRA